MSETIDAIMAWFDGKLQKMLIYLTKISTHNPSQINFNTHLFCYFSQVGIHIGKRSKCPYIDSKLLYTPKEEFF
jgi:hypothetical protein